MIFAYPYQRAREEFWKEVLKLASQDPYLIKKGVSVAGPLLGTSAMSQQGDCLLGITGIKKQRIEPIDVLRIHHSSELAWKAEQILETVHLVSKKAVQHLKAKRIPGILISPLGRKVDTRLLPQHLRMRMEGFGRLTLNHHPIHPIAPLPCLIEDGDVCPCTSHTITRAILWQNKVRLVDEQNLSDVARTYIGTIDLLYQKENREERTPYAMRFCDPIELSLEDREKIQQIIRRCAP